MPPQSDCLLVENDCALLNLNLGVERGQERPNARQMPLYLNGDVRAQGQRFAHRALVVDAPLLQDDQVRANAGNLRKLVRAKNDCVPGRLQRLDHVTDVTLPLRIQTVSRLVQ